MMNRRYYLAGLAPILILAIFGCIGGVSTESGTIESFKTPEWEQGDYWILKTSTGASTHTLWYVNGTKKIEVNGKNITTWVVLRISQDDNETIDIFYFDEKEYTLIRYEEYRVNVTSGVASGVLLSRVIEFEPGLPVFGLEEWEYDKLYNEGYQYFYHYYEYYEEYYEEWSYLIIAFQEVETVYYDGEEHRILTYFIFEEDTGAGFLLEYDLEEGFFWQISEGANILDGIFESSGRLASSGNVATFEELKNDSDNDGFYDILGDIQMRALTVSFATGSGTITRNVYNSSSQLYLNGTVQAVIDGGLTHDGIQRNLTNTSAVIYIEVYSFSEDLEDMNGDGWKRVAIVTIDNPSWVNTASGSQANITALALTMIDTWSVTEGDTDVEIRVYVVDRNLIDVSPTYTEDPTT